MINELNEEQIKLMEVVKQEWIDRLDSCPHPNHEAIISGVRWLYSFCKLKDPLVVIVQSPLGAQIAANMLCADQVSAQVHAQVSDQVYDQVYDQVHDQVSDQVHAQVSDQVRDQVYAQVRDQVHDQVSAQVYAQVYAQVSDQVHAQVYAQVSAQVHDQVYAQVRDQVRDQVSDQVHDQMYAQVHAQVSAQVYDQVHAQVYAQVSAQVHDQVQYFCFSTYGNIWDFGWLSFYDFFARIGIKHKVKAFAAFRTLMQSGLYDMIQLDGACIVSEMPTEIHRDNRGRLHNVEGPAIKFGDGYEMYSLFGVRLDKEIHAKICSGSMCIKDIFAIENIEQRMVALKMRGAEKILEESKAQLLDSSARGNQLYILKEVFSVPAYFLKYKDPSTDRVYVSGIDPEIGIDANADKAMAWKFNLNAEEYSQLLTINEA